MINNYHVKSVNIEFPKISQGCPITTFNFGENMIGKISTIMLFKHPITSAK